MLRVLHTADWHLGYVPQMLSPDDTVKLARARLAVLDKVMGVAFRHDVHAILCAGDLFDTPTPDAQWWQGLLDVFAHHPQVRCPILLLPGNHDPIQADSVYHKAHPFRRGLPEHVHVVSEAGFSFPLGDDAVVLAAPCTSTAGDRDLALSLPAREPGDTRIRIGLVHGSTFDMKGHETNFPIAKDAAEQRGLDYLAIGDTHALREVVPNATAPTYYPGAPEATGFGEKDTGYVLVVTFTRAGVRPRVRPEQVGRWRWRDVSVRSLPALRSLVEEPLESTVLRLRLDLEVPLSDKPELDHLVERLSGSIARHGRAGAVVVERAGLRLALDGAALPADVPDAVREVEAALRAQAETDTIAKQALVVLHRLARELYA